MPTNQPHKFDKKILKLNVPVLGICFGHQILSKELGGRGDFAQAGGTLPNKIDESFESIKKLIN